MEEKFLLKIATVIGRRTESGAQVQEKPKPPPAPPKKPAKEPGASKIRVPEKPGQQGSTQIHSSSLHQTIYRPSECPTCGSAHS